MRPRYFLPGMLLSALALMPVFSAAQQAGDAAVPDVAASQQAVAPSFSQQDLDQLLAPIALYPDPLLAQIFMAATYPLEVVQAARWVKANPKVTGKQLEEAMSKQSWDPAVKAMTSVPQVLQQMNEKLDWTQKLGDAFLAQQQDVMDTVQSLRAKAYAAGNLKTSDQQVVTTETQGPQTIYVVQPASPQVVYVPTYNPTVVYGRWWYAQPPYYMYPPAYVYPPGVVFATGIVVGAAIWGNCNWGWGHSHVNVNVAHYNSFNRTTVTNNNWHHNVSHRGGVAYADKRVAQQYNRASSLQATQSREAFRGREAGEGTGSGDMKGRAQDRRAEQGAGAARSNRSNDLAGSGFSGLGNGASTREASQRGGTSRAGMSHARAGGGHGAAGGGRHGGGGRR